MRKYRIYLCLVVASVFVNALSVMAAAPVAMVEDSSGGAVGVGAFDMLDEGRQISLGADGVLVLGYLQSCVHERIEGGQVMVGREQSVVHDGKVHREKVECSGENLILTAAQKQASGAIVMRGLSKPAGKMPLVHNVRPFIFTSSSGDIVLSRAGNPGDRHSFSAQCQSEGRCGVDLVETDLSLEPGATYQVRLGSKVVTFSVAADAVDVKPATLLGRIVFVR